MKKPYIIKEHEFICHVGRCYYHACVYSSYLESADYWNKVGVYNVSKKVDNLLNYYWQKVRWKIK